MPCNTKVWLAPAFRRPEDRGAPAQARGRQTAHRDATTPPSLRITIAPGRCIRPPCCLRAAGMVSCTALRIDAAVFARLLPNDVPTTPTLLSPLNFPPAAALLHVQELSRGAMQSDRAPGRADATSLVTVNQGRGQQGQQGGAQATSALGSTGNSTQARALMTQTGAATGSGSSSPVKLLFPAPLLGGISGAPQETALAAHLGVSAAVHHSLPAKRHRLVAHLDAAMYSGPGTPDKPQASRFSQDQARAAWELQSQAEPHASGTMASTRWRLSFQAGTSGSDALTQQGCMAGDGGAAAGCAPVHKLPPKVRIKAQPWRRRLGETSVNGVPAGSVHACMKQESSAGVRGEAHVSSALPAGQIMAGLCLITPAPSGALNGGVSGAIIAEQADRPAVPAPCVKDSPGERRSGEEEREDLL